LFLTILSGIVCCQDQGNARVRIPPGRLFVSDDIIRDCLLPV